MLERQKKELLQQKLKAKYAYREKQSELEIRKAKLQFLKSDKESALERYKEEDDNELKILHKSEYILLSKAYMNELQSFVLSGKPEKDDRMHASEDDDTNENEAEADYSTSAKNSNQNTMLKPRPILILLVIALVRLIDCRLNIVSFVVSFTFIVAVIILMLSKLF